MGKIKWQAGKAWKYTASQFHFLSIYLDHANYIMQGVFKIRTEEKMIFKQYVSYIFQPYAYLVFLQTPFFFFRWFKFKAMYLILNLKKKHNKYTDEVLKMQET